MQDMLVRLYDLPEMTSLENKLQQQQIIVRHAQPWEKQILCEWLEHHFSPRWAREIEKAFSMNPVSCYLALAAGNLAGFAAYECTCKNFFGPTGVSPRWRKKGIGQLLLLKALYSMREKGYAYAVIGGVGPAAFYEKRVGAFIIPGSDPGIYTPDIKAE